MILTSHHRRFVQAPLRMSDAVVMLAGSAGVAVVAAGEAVPGAPPCVPVAAYAAVAVGAGTWLLTARRVASDPLWRRYLGVGVVLWGIGQLIVAGELAAGAYATPSIGDVVSILAFPLMIAGFGRAVRSEAFVRPVLRLTIDAVLIASATAMLVWRLAAETGARSHLDAFVALGVLWLDSVVAAFGLLVFIRRPSRSTALLAGGMLVFAVADAMTTVELLDHARVGAVGASLYCLGLPAAATGARIVAPEPHDGGDLRRDLRQAVVAMVITALVVAGVAVDVAIDRRVPAIELIVLGIVTIAAFFVRHFVDHRQRAVLLDQMVSQATHDALTGVGNRYAIDDLNAHLAVDEADVVVVGIDGLAAVTSTLGHVSSDLVLVEVASALDVRFSDAYGIVRLDSDEFAIVLPRTGVVTELAVVARDVTRAAALHQLDGGPRVRVTSGAACGQAFDRDLFDLVGRAQRARHLASVTPDVSVRVYDDALRAADERERLIDERLATAIRCGAITAHFQPVVDVATGKVVGVESLARWVDPLLGVVDPNQFIGRAEATGQIGALGRGMLRQAAQTAAALGLPARGVSTGVNVSAAQLRRRERDGTGFADMVEVELAEHGVPPDQLVVEVTESMLVEEHDPAIEELHRLRALGVKVAIDDFGSGYWALGYFRWFDADIVKIDRSLVAQLATDARSRAVVASIVDLASRIGMRTVAEGIEDQEVVHAAKQLGVSALQGWEYSRAVPVVQLERVIDQLDARPLLTSRDRTSLVRLH